MTCRRCHKSKPTIAFSWRKIGKIRHKMCKPCYRIYTNQHYQQNINSYKTRKRRNQKISRYQNRLFAWKYRLAHPCIDCGDIDPVVLDFDHKSGKLMNVSKMINSYPLETLKREIAKCVVRCCKCHRKKTAKDFGWYKDFSVLH